MNDFIRSAMQLIYKNGVNISVTTIAEGAYDKTLGKVTKTEVSTPVKAFPKTIKANTFNYPSLIDKELVEFLVVSQDLPTKPKATDKITWSGVKYLVVSTKEHTAEGSSVIYKILTSKV